MFFRILAMTFLGAISVCSAQDQIILRNKDTINCKLTNLDQYYTYFISPENPSHILQVSNVHVKKIHNVTFTKQKEWLLPNKDTSDYKASSKVTVSKFKKNPNADNTSASKPQSKVSTSDDSVQTSSLKEESFILTSFSILPINAGLGVNNTSSFRYVNTRHGNFAVNAEWVNLGSVGMSAYVGYSTYTYFGSFTSPDRVLNASFQKSESGIAFGLGPNVSYRTSRSSFLKFNVGMEALVKPKLKYEDIELSRGNLNFRNSIHTGNKTNSESKVGVNLGISYHKQLNDVLVLSFGIGYKGMRQKFLASNKLKNDEGTLELNDRVGFQTEHFLTSFLSIGAQF